MAPSPTMAAGRHGFFETSQPRPMASLSTTAARSVAAQAWLNVVLTTGANGTFTNNGGNGQRPQFGYTDFDGSSAHRLRPTRPSPTTAAQSAARWRRFSRLSRGSTAADSTIINNGATVSGAVGGITVFHDTSTAGSATLIANGGTNGGKVGELSLKTVPLAAHRGLRFSATATSTLARTLPGVK